MSRSITLAHGQGALTLQPPSDLEVQALEATGLGAAADAAGEVARALDSPVGRRRLETLAAGRRRACVLVPDGTRRCPLTAVLPSVLAALERGRLGPGETEILIATGLHALPDDAEIRSLLGPTVADHWPVESSDARDAEAFVDLRPDSSAGPVRLHRRWVESDLRVVVSLVEPHLLAGYSGGAKMILPGVADVATIWHAHRPAIIGDRAARAGRVRGNPLVALTHLAARLTPVDFHMALAVDGEGRLAGAWAGELMAAHSAAIAAVAAASHIRVQRPFDAAVTCGGGWPSDRTFYQSVKGLCAAARVVKPGGPLWLLAPCTAGVGSADFEGLLGRVDSPQCLRALLQDPLFFTIDQWMAQHLYDTASEHPIIVQSEGLNADWLRGRGLEAVGSEERGWEALRAHVTTNGRRVAVFPRGPLTFATLAADSVDTAVSLGVEEEKP